MPLAALEAALPEWFAIDIEGLTPPEALHPLAEGLAIRVSQHEKNCTHVPPALKSLAGMRRHTLLRPASLDRMREVLWRNRDHPFIEDLCEAWIKFQAKRIPDWADTGEGLSFPEVVSFAREDRDRLADLASVLWALKLDQNPVLQWSFRLVCGLLSRAASEESPSPASSEQTENDSASRRRLKTAQREAVEAARLSREETRDARREARRAKEALKSAEAEREQLRQQLDEVKAQEAASSGELSAARAEIDELRKGSLRVEDESAQYLRLTETLEGQIEDLTATIEAGEEQKLALTGALDEARREVAELRKKLEQLGTSDERFLVYLTSELEQLRDDSIRLQGGDAAEVKARASKIRKVRDAFLDYRPDLRTPPPAVRVPRASLQFRGLGGTTEIGASSYLLNIGDYRVLIDCGIRMGAPLENLGPALTGMEPPDAVILTHAHSDHIAWMPALLNVFGADAPFEIYATTETSRLAPIMLRDARRNLERQMAAQRLLSRWDTTRRPPPEPYTRRDIERVLTRLHPVNLRQTVPLGGDLRFTLYRAGHILGAASVLIEGEGRRVFVSGDFADFWQLTAEGSDWPEDIEHVDLLILESTYADRTHRDRSEERMDFVQSVHRTIESGGVALLPCFALGRAQEVLSILEQAMPNDARFPVWIDGMVQQVNDVYRNSRDDFDLPANFHQVRKQGFSTEEVIHRARKDPCAIVSSSGMLMGGPIIEYVEALLPNPANRVFICGHQDEGSPGRALQRLMSGSDHVRELPVQKEDGTQRTVRVGSPAATFNLSAHADRNGLLEAVERTHPKATLLVHGLPDAQGSFTETLQERGFTIGASRQYEVPAE